MDSDVLGLKNSDLKQTKGAWLLPRPFSFKTQL
jgi:hypothetical protein